MSPSAVRPARGRLATLGKDAVLLAVGTMGANVFAYGSLLILNRALAPATLGAVAALLNLVVIVAVPALALQLVTARQMAQHHADVSIVHRSALATAVRLGALSMGGTMLATPALVPLLHLDGWWPPVLAAIMMGPTCVTFAVQGALQGAGRFGALTAVYLVSSGLRLGAAAAAAALGHTSATSVLAFTTLGSVLGMGFSLLFVRSSLRASSAAGRASLWLHQVFHGSAATSALLVVTNVDILLARAFLTGAQSGQYAVVSVFAKAAFWGPSFLVTLLYPRMARGRGHRSVTAAVVAATTLGVLAVGLAWLWQDPLIRIVGGARYGSLASLVPLFAALGSAWSVVQVLVYWRLARADHRLAYTTWLVALAAVALIAVSLHNSVGQIAGSLLAAGLLVTAYGTALLIRRQRKRDHEVGATV